MPREFLLPDIGEGLTEAEIVRWLVPEGERVAADQPVVEVETDKAVVEIPSPFAGIVLRHGGAEGETIEVGQVLVVIGDESDVDTSRGEARDTQRDHEPVAEDMASVFQTSVTSAAPIVGTLSEEAEVLTTNPADSTRGDSVKALPLVRKLARDLGVDITRIEGSGADGRVVREDVLAAANQVAGSTPEPEHEHHEQEEQVRQEEPVDTSKPVGNEEKAEVPPIRVVASGETERRPLTRLRKTIAANMSRSWAEIPHVTTFEDVDAGRLLEVRSALGARHGSKIAIEALVMKAVIPALEEFPEFNATLEGDELVIHGSHDIGIAVDTPDGLLVAVIRDAGRLGVLDLSAEVRRVGEGARKRSLSPDELSGQTFTMSNIGAVGGGHGTPIIPYGTTAILSVGMAREKVIAYDGEIAIAPIMPLSLSYDHRVIDGAQGRRFISLVVENLEEPALFLAG
ncbi:MAG: dihydrolipoamide acetyltransferase family protein [Acidimicrobiia bacterium]